MVKSYLRYERERSFGVIASTEGNVLYDRTGTLAIAPALKDIYVWNIRQGNKIREFLGENGQVTTLELSRDGVFLAAGYSTGIIRIFRFATGALEIVLDGHTSAVETLVYSKDGSRLASGGRDTDIIIWDIVSQSGLFRLKGHKDAVTCAKFLGPEEKLLVSSSKDTLLKVWDLETQHCIETCVGHRSEVWGFTIDPDSTRVLTGASDNRLRLYEVNLEADVGSNEKILNPIGAIVRQTNDRTVALHYHTHCGIIGVQTSGRSIELYRRRSKEEMKKKQARREKRLREKMKKKEAIEESNKAKIEIKAHDTNDDTANLAMEEFDFYSAVRSTHKIKSFAFAPQTSGSSNEISILLGLLNNSLETHQIVPQSSSVADQSATVNVTKVNTLALNGHRSDVRFVALSSDDQLLLSLSHSSVKIWNTRSFQCIRTLSDNDHLNLALTAAFAPGNMHVVVGTKSGAILIFDLNSGSCCWKDLHAHGDSAVWSIDVRPDGKGIVSGGADQQVNFWDFELVQPDSAIETSEKLVLGLSHTRALKMTDDVLCVRFSNTKDAKKLVVAVALLDCTVKIFHDDSLKFFVSLYGHKLPVMAMDISSDDSVIVTASADKNVKLWGLDFGDCHKSIFAHADSIMSVKFIQKTHYFLTASKDKTVAYWDGDHFERILQLKEDHFAAVWGIAITTDGSSFFTCSGDRSICKYTRTDDQVFLEEEKEKELDELFEEELTKSKQSKKDFDGGDASASASKRTIDSVIAGERLIEAIDLATKELNEIKAHEERQKKKKAEERIVRQPNLLLLGFSPLKYVLHTLRRIRPAEIEESLLVLPFEDVEKLISLLLQMVKKQLEVELCCQIVLLLLKFHHQAIWSQTQILKELESLWDHLRTQILAKRNRIGVNLAGMKFLKRQLVDSQTVFVEDVQPGPGVTGRKKKRKMI